jgi:hypothetical protein
VKDGVEDDAVIAVASNNWVAERLASEGDAAPKKLCVELLKKFEGFFEKVSACTDVSMSLPVSVAAAMYMRPLRSLI